MRVLHYIPRNILVGCDQAGERLVDHKSIHMSSQVVPSVGQLHLSWSSSCLVWMDGQAINVVCGNLSKNTCDHVCNQRHWSFALHLGHGNLPCTYHPMKSENANRSCIECLYQTCILKIFLLAASYVCIPFTQAYFKSSISGCRYTFVFFLGYLSRGIISDRNMCMLCIRTSGVVEGKTNTCQQLYIFETKPNGLNPSSQMETRPFLATFAFSGCNRSKFCHARAQDGCVNIGLPWSSLSRLIPYLCHTICSVVSSFK